MTRQLLALAALFAVVAVGAPALRLEWMYLGLGGALFLAVAYLANPAAWAGRRLALALLVAYLVHQFEEHGFDLLGHRYAFQASANAVLGPVLGCAPGAECPLTVDAIFWVNTLLVWWPYALAVLFGARRPAMVVAVSGLTLANAIAHVVPAVLKGAYDPGLLTAVLLFVPVGALTWRTARRRWGAHRQTLGLAFAWGALGHPLLLVGAFAVYSRGLAPGWAYPVFLVAYASLPLAAPTAKLFSRS
ncbi:MAG: HXXEE domain-containing protein [Myxococcaceae bacterium]